MSLLRSSAIMAIGRNTKKQLSTYSILQRHIATRVIIGGSFITKLSNPEDLDCLIVFPSDRYIPDFVDCAQMDNISYDILYAIEKMVEWS